MPYEAKTYRVMIASPSDVAKERHFVSQALYKWNAAHSFARKIVVLPVAWETHTHPEMGNEPQKIINKQILNEADILVGVFWTRLGTPTSSYSSGTVEEIEEHIKTGKQAMLYFSNQPVSPDSINQDQYKKLVEFKENCKTRGLYKEYEDISDFQEIFTQDLQLLLNNKKFHNAPDVNLVEVFEKELANSLTFNTHTLSNEAQKLILAAQRGDGSIYNFESIGAHEISSNGQNFLTDTNQRTIARWESAINELENADLIEDKSGNEEIYYLTHQGYEAADELSTRK